MEFDINDVAAIGSVRDIPPYQLPPEVWSLALNMRYADDSLQALDGWAPIFFDPPTPIIPHFTFPVTTSAQAFWVYTGLEKAVVWTGTAHVDITRLSDLNKYNATDTYQWNGTMLGEILIVNNGVDPPQQWKPPATTKMINLTGWPPNTKAKVIRSFGSFLIAVHITDDDGTHDHRVKWSHPANPGEVPVTWNPADTTRDAGQLDLPDVASGILMDLLPLGSTMFLYKESSIWKMRYVGGQSVFDIGQSAWINTAGLLGQRCVCLTGDGTKHVMATQDDIIWHNGNTVQSILNKRQRKRLQDEMDPVSFFQSFIFANPFNNEVWFCYPSQGNLYPNRALIMNYKEAGGTNFVVTEADGITFRNAAVGAIETFNPEIWNENVPDWLNSTAYVVGDRARDPFDGRHYEALIAHTSPATGTFVLDRLANPTRWQQVIIVANEPDPDAWDSFTGPWSQLERRKVVVVAPATNRFYNFGVGTRRDGQPYMSTLQREGLGLIGKKRDGGPIVDHQRMKMLTRLWPKIRGGPVNVRFGSQQTVKGPTSWGSQVLYDPATTVYCDPGPVTGRAVGFELSQQDVLWGIDGYKISVQPLGEY